MPRWPITDAGRFVGSLSQEAKEWYWGEKMSVILTMYVVPKEAGAWDPAQVVDKHSTYDDLNLLVPDMIRFSQRMRGEKEIDADWLMNSGDSFEVSCLPVGRVREGLRQMDDFFRRHAHRFALHYRFDVKPPSTYEFYFGGDGKIYRLMASDGECYAQPEPFSRGAGPVIDFREGQGPRMAKAAVRDPKTNTYSTGDDVVISVLVETLWDWAHGPQLLALTEKASDDDHKIYITRG